MSFLNKGENKMKCYDYYCDKENLSCFVDCNTMKTNMVLLKDIHDKINNYENMLDGDTETSIYQLKRDFQNNFLKLCNDFISTYDRIITNIEIRK
jgi:hypothetical protein